MSNLNEQFQYSSTNPNKENYLFSQQAIDRQRFNQIQMLNKNDQDYDHVQFTSPTQNLVPDQSELFHQEKKKCLFCRNLQKEIQSIKRELQNQKKKNKKYLRIINAKVDKEKELKIAYCQIAKELKKKIDAAQQYQIQQICRGKQQNYRISEQKYRIQSIMNRVENNHQDSLAKIKGQKTCFKEQSEKHQFNFVPFQVICLKGFQGNCQGFKLEQNRQIQRNKYLKEQRQSEEETQINNFILKQEQQLLNINKSNEKSYETVKQLQSQSFYSVNYNHSLSEISKQIKLIEQSSLNREKQFKKSALQRQSSYYSIQQDQQIVEISNVSMKNSFSIQENDKKSQRSFLNKLKSQKSYEIIQKEQDERQFYRQKNFVQRNNKDHLMRQIEQQRQKIKHFVLNIKQFFEKLNNQLNNYGHKYKIRSILPKVITNYGLIQANKSLNLQNLLIQKDKIQEILLIFTQHLYNIFKHQQKQYQIRLNDKDLIIYDIKNKFTDLQKQKKESQKIIQNYQMHKQILQLKFLQLQEKAIDTGSQIRQPSTNRSQYVSKLKKRVSIMISQRTKNKEIQCNILSQNQLQQRSKLQSKNHQLTQALNQVPIILNQICAKRQVNEIFTINFQDNLQQQLSQMLRNSYQHLRNQQIKQIHSSHSHSTTRIRSASLSPTIIRKRSQYYQINPLQIQNKQLKITLQLKSQQLLKCSEKISLLRMQKSSFDAKMEALTLQIERINKVNQQLSSQIYSSPIKNQISQSRLKNSRCSIVGSEKGEFMQYQQKKEYNNLYWDRDEQLKQLKIKIQIYQQQLNKFRLQNKKKKKIVYIDK